MSLNRAEAEVSARFRESVSPSGEETTDSAARQLGLQKQPRLLRAGDVIAHYELIRPLGRGGMGEVFLARDNRLGRRVAIKFIPATDEDRSRRFVAEARATAACAHENIVVIHEADVYDKWNYLVLEFLQGQTFYDLAQAGPLKPQRAVELIIPVVRALSAAHAQGIIHRDLKLENVFLTESGTVKVLDFGIAKIEKAGAIELLDSGPLLGTFSYMAPEQWNRADVDHRADIWAVGMMLFRLLAGRHPFPALRGAELAVTGNVDVPMPTIESAAPLVPLALAQIINRCLRKKPQERFPDASSLLRPLEAVLPNRALHELKAGECPYRGLVSFQESDDARFFGRNSEISAFIARLRAQPLLAVVGASGAGKSSLIRAGVVPALKRSGEGWQALMMRPARRPLEALVDALCHVELSGEVSPQDLAAREKLITRLKVEPGYAGTALRAHARGAGCNVLLFVDQFEELYTHETSPQERDIFTRCLASIADDASSPIRVVLSMRADFLDRAAENSQFMSELSQGLFFLHAPAREGLAEALLQPAEMAGYRFEGNIVQDMLGHLATTQGALPLLQFAATQLWETRDSARHLLTAASYRAMGGIQGALTSHADAVLRELPTDVKAVARAVLTRLVTPDFTRALVSMEELRELSPNRAATEQLIDHLVRARLLLVQTTSGSPTVELVHESLISTWPILRRWLEEGREDQAIREQLRTAARQWEQRSKDGGLLWSGDTLREALAWQKRHPRELPARETGFLDASFRQATRASRIRRSVLLGILAVLTMMVVGSGIFSMQLRTAESAARTQAELAEKEAARARYAESDAREKLRQLHEEQRAKANAEAAVAQGRDNLRAVNLQLEKALEQSKASTRTAQELAVSLKEANANLARLLAEERARVERLERERKKITTELR